MRILTLCLSSLLIASCSLVSPPQATEKPSVSAAGPTIALSSNFESIRQNILVSKCLGCHQPQSPSKANKILFSTETELLAASNEDGPIVTPGNAKESAFFKVKNSDPQVRGDLAIMPPEKAVESGRIQPVTIDELKIVELWINQLSVSQQKPPEVIPAPPHGGDDQTTAPIEPPPTDPSMNPPPSGSSESDILWNRVQQQIINTKCLTCHKAGGRAEGLPMESKDQLLQQIIDGVSMIQAGAPLKSAFFKVLHTNSETRGPLLKMPPLKAINNGTVKEITVDDIKLVSDWIQSLSESPGNSSSGSETNPEKPPTSDESDPLPQPMSEEVARGKYMFDAGGCIHCHTTNAAKPLAGGYPMTTIFGKFITPNISPDVKTGIGGWSKKQFIEAMRNGISPAGEYYYPTFPYTSYSKMSDQDISAIQAYIMTQKPVSHANAPHQVKFPYNKRSLLFFWRTLNFTKVSKPTEENFVVAKGAFKSIPDRDEVWNRGAYLVEGAFHCAQCHSPRNSLGGFLKNSWLSGATMFGETKIAPNLTPDLVTGLGRWSDQNWKTFLRQGVTPLGDVVSGDMAKIIKQGTSRLTDKDLDAVIVYLQGLKPVKNEKAPSESKK